MHAFARSALPRMRAAVVIGLLGLAFAGPARADSFADAAAAEKRGDFEVAAGFYRQAADAGNLPALARLGALYEDGKGVPQDLVTAFKWYRQAAEQGDVASQYGLGLLYADGRGVPRNPAEATRWLTKAASRGSLMAQARLLALKAGAPDTSIVRLKAKPLRFFDNADALARGAAALAAGHDDEAARWFALPAQRGNAAGAVQLGRLAREGRGLPKSAVEAASWFRKAADLGDADGQAELAAVEASIKVAEVVPPALPTPPAPVPAPGPSDVPAPVVTPAPPPAPSPPVVAPIRQQRVALVIANGAYGSQALSNPPIDAGLVAAALESMGFKVEVAKDTDLASFGDALAHFRERAKGADVALFYFAGHGFALPDGLKPRNYLMSTSADLSSRSDLVLRAGGVPLDEIVDAIAGSAKVTLVFVDACRNDPKSTRGISGGRGLARIDRSGLSNVFIGLSTRIEQTADDGNPGKGSPFARAFAAILPKKAQRLDDAFREIRKSVMEETGGKQLPDVQEDDLDAPLVLMDGP